MSFPGDPNPYAPPRYDPEEGWKPGECDELLHKVIRDFRSQVLALGVLWILLGLVGWGIGISVALDQTPDPSWKAVLGFGLTVGTLLVVVGVSSIRKQLWALHVGLVCAYLFACMSLLTLNICLVIVMVMVIVQSHRVLGFAKTIRAAGLPLTTRAP